MLAAVARVCCSLSSSPSSSVLSLRRRLFSIIRNSTVSSSNAIRTANSYGKHKQLYSTTANGCGCSSWRRRTKREFFTMASVVIDAVEESKSFVSVEIVCHNDVADVLSDALLCFGASSASIDQSSSSVGDSNEENFHPVKVSTGLWIVPQWIIPPEPQAINVILNPGMAFGTGDHPTTKLCLLLLKNIIRGGESLMDYGTGSGILGIAALKLGGSFSVGIDIDAEAISSAQKNIALNQIAPNKMHLYLGDSRVPSLLSGDETSNDEISERMFSNCPPLSHRRGKFDIVLANILLNPLVELAGNIVSYAKPGAVIGLSGILTDQLPIIEDCYSRYMERISTSEMDGWACLSGTRKME